MNNNPLDHKPDKSPFTARPPVLKLWQIAAIMLFEMALILLSLFFGTPSFMVSTMIALTMITAFIISWVQQKINDDRTLSEFLSLALAESMRSTTVLSIIVRRDGSIYYLDPRYVRNFADGREYHNLDNVLNTLTIKQPERRKIFDELALMHPYSQDFRFKRKLGELLGLNDLDLNISIYPLHRPEGYSYIAVTYKQDAVD